ncbi:MAG: hypothetical protein ACREGA_05170 [Candidatus Saccharimonadales bacterium]
MTTTQYTIRGIPKQLDSRLRRLARLRGQSLNRVVLEQLAAQPDFAQPAAARPKKPTVNRDFDQLFERATALDRQTEAAMASQRLVSPKDW